MLLRLRIENLAVIESAEAVFGAGLNSVTGETGAGKSVFIGALELALGARASADAVRAGAKVAVAEASFSPPFPGELLAVAEELGLELDREEPLSIRREISTQGRNRCFVAGQMVNVADLRRLGDCLADLHGQHEHQSLFRPAAQRAALDAFAGSERELAAYRERHETFVALRRRKEELDNRAADLERRRDYLEFQIEELARADPKPGESAELEAEEARLSHAETLAGAAEAAYAALYEGADDSARSALDALGEASRELARIARLDPAEGEPLATRLGEIEALAQDLARDVRDYGGRREPDPERLNEVVARSEAIAKLLRKHGAADEEELVATLAALREEADRIESDDREREEIDAKLERARAELAKAADALHAVRAEAAARMAAEIKATLAEVAMEKADFRLEVERVEDFAADGADRVEFLLAANPGEGFKTLRDTASGGELSRTMLAIKTALARRDAIPTLVFDEIDAGISGEAAARVGRLLQRLGASHQILCITHHASIAARGARHLSVRKGVKAGRTTIATVLLEGEDRLEELARMMGGDGKSAEGKRLAEQLIAG